MKILISHPTGNQNVRAAVSGFAQAGIASAFNTTIASFEGDLLDRLSAVSAFSELRRRKYDARIKGITETWPWIEWSRLIALKWKLRHLVRHERGPFSIDAVYRSLDRHVAKKLKHKAGEGTTAVYAYEDGARLSFRSAKTLGLQCFYDLPVGYWRAGRSILEAESARWPEWSSTLIGLQNSNEKLTHKDEEIGAADRIYVASRFTAKTLAHYPGALPPVEVIPYGFPAVAKGPGRRNTNRPLKLLFVGGITQRKGIIYLFEAVRPLRNHVSLTVIGHKPNNNCPALNRALARHTWIPGMPHSEILKIMRCHDVLVFPSLFEGFGLVISEAMSQGTPVITTDRTAGPDLITHNKNGWIIRAGSTEALREALEEILAKRNDLFETGCAAFETARLRPWSVYARELSDSVQQCMVSEKSEKLKYEQVPI